MEVTMRVKKTSLVRKQSFNVSFSAALLMFLVIYHPPIFGFNILYLVAPFSWLYLCCNFVAFKNSLSRSYIKNIIPILVCLILYQTLISAVNGYLLITASVGMIWWLACIIPASFCALIMIKKKRGDVITFANSLLIAALAQCALCLAAFLSPNVQSFFLRRVLANNPSLDYLTDTRMYGFAMYLTGFTGMAQGFIAAFFLYLGLQKKKSYLIFVPIILLSGLVNARTSVVIFIAAAIIVMVFSKIPRSRKIIIIAASVLLVLALIRLGIYLKENSDNNTIVWILDGFDVINSFFKGETSGYFVYATNADKYAMPEGVRFVFGAGTKIFIKTNEEYTSDIGFVNDVWVGGIVFAFAYYCLWLKMLFPNFKDVFKSESLPVSLIILSSFLLSNFKGIVNTDNDFVSSVFLILICLVYGGLQNERKVA